MANSSWLEPTDNMYGFLMLAGGAMGLALYLQVLRKRFYWVVMETMLGVISLVCLPFSSDLIANHQSTGTNSLAEYLFKLMAFTKVCQAAVVFLTRNSKDRMVATAISVTNVLSRTIMQMCLYHGIYHATTINKDMLKRDIIVVLLLIIGDLCQISRVSSHEGCLTVRNNVNFHLLIDGILGFIMASWIFGFPKMFLAVINPEIVPNEGQLALAKMIGCVALGCAVLSFAAFYFKSNVDRIAVLKAKLVFYFPSLISGVMVCVSDTRYCGLGHIVLVLGSMTLLSANAIYAIWHVDKDKVE